MIRILFSTLLISASLVCCGCVNSKVEHAEPGVLFGDTIRTMEYDGHKYVVYRTDHGVAMCLAPVKKAEK